MECVSKMTYINRYNVFCNRFPAPQSDYLSHPPPAVTYPPPSPGQHMSHYPGPPHAGYPQRFNGYNYGKILLNMSLQSKIIILLVIIG